MTGSRLHIYEELPPALLRTELPTIVLHTCEDGYQVLTWLAMRWLIALSGAAQAALTGREIARVAKCSLEVVQACLRNPQRAEGQAGARRSLIELDLIEVVSEIHNRNLYATPVYRIPRRIEAENAAFTRALLQRLNIPTTHQAISGDQMALPLDDLAPAQHGPPTDVERLIAYEELPPALLRTELPTIVRERCTDAYQILTWLAVRWHIALADKKQAPLDSAVIAATAKLNRKTVQACLTWNPGHSKDTPRKTTKRRRATLVELGLLEIAGYHQQGNGNIAPKPVYRIPSSIEEQNAPFTYRLLFLSAGTAPGSSPYTDQSGQPSDRYTDWSSDRYTDWKNSSDASQSPEQASSSPYTDQSVDSSPSQSPEQTLSSPYTDQSGQPSDRYTDWGSDRYTDWSADSSVSQSPEQALSSPYTDQSSASSDRYTDWSATPSASQSPETGSSSPYTDQSNDASSSPYTDHVVVVVGGDDHPLPAQARTENDDTVLALPAPPSGAAPLSAHPFDLWYCAHGALTALQRHQLLDLAGQYDPKTGGYGLYWVGRAILAPSYQNGPAQTIAIVKKVLRSWNRKGNWGEDIEDEAIYERQAGAERASERRSATGQQGGAGPAAARTGGGRQPRRNNWHDQSAGDPPSADDISG